MSISHFRPLHVVHVIPLIALGGVWRHLQTVSRLQLRGIRQTIVSLYSTSTDGARQLLNLPVFQLDIPKHSRTNRSFVSETLRQLLQSLGPDLVHSHHYSSDIVALPAAKQFGIPAIRTVHGITQAGPIDPLYRGSPRLDWCLQQVSDELALEAPTVRTLTVCRLLRDKLLRYGFAPDRVSTMYLGIDAVEIATGRTDTSSTQGQDADRCIVVGFAGRLEPIKNPGMMCRLAALFRTSKQNIEIRIVGSGSLQAELDAAIKLDELHELVKTRPGGIQMQRDIGLFDILVVPSLLEGIPLVALEAMSFSIPVVASAVGGIPELIDHNSNGVLFRSDDVRDLYANLLPLLDDPDRRRRLGEAGFMTVKERFSLSAHLQQLEQVYGESFAARR
jgi:glycosyltransferase involved in cell wall biosynthesis